VVMGFMATKSRKFPFIWIVISFLRETLLSR
jgi:hypothetical protein